MTDIRRDLEKGQLYGFGATAPEARFAVHRRTAGLLSIVAIALVAAVAAMVFTALPIDSASASTFSDTLTR
jgi:hypothetical protein